MVAKQQDQLNQNSESVVEELATELQPTKGWNVYLTTAHNDRNCLQRQVNTG